MTHFVHVGDGVIVITITEEAKQKCEDCGKVAETRPYGKGGMRVCYQCAMKDEAEAQRQFLMRTEQSVRH